MGTNVKEVRFQHELASLSNRKNRGNQVCDFGSIDLNDGR